MLRLSSLNRFLMVTLLSSLAAIPAHADGINNPTYSVTGVMILTGNNTCTPAPCTEAIAFSFDLGYEVEIVSTNNYAYFAEVTNVTAIWTGDMASFTQYLRSLFIGNVVPASSPGGCSGDDSNYIAFLDAGGDEADLHLCDNAEPTPVVPSLSFADLYRCETAACANEFVPSFFVGASLQDVTVTQLPEPPTLIQLASGMLALGVMLATSRKFLTRSTSAEFHASLKE